jgi:hypothetical protein
MLVSKGGPVYTPDGVDPAFDITGEDFLANFPNMTQSEPPFVPTYFEADSYQSFFDEVYDFRNVAPVYPYSYGSMQVFQANSQSHQI